MEHLSDHDCEVRLMLLGHFACRHYISPFFLPSGCGRNSRTGQNFGNRATVGARIFSTIAKNSSFGNGFAAFQPSEIRLLSVGPLAAASALGVGV